MTQEEFIKLLEQKRIDFDSTGSGITVTHEDTIIPRVTTLLKGVKFASGGSVFLNILTELPEETKFENDDDLYLTCLTELSKGIEFRNRGDIYLDSLTELPDGTEFHNGGSVYLIRLTKLPEGIKFENSGSVLLDSLIELPKGTEFRNSGGVYLYSLTDLPKGIEFQNGGNVYIPFLKENQHYLGKEREFRNIDGFTTIICETKESNGYQIHSARYFGGGAIEDLKRCYIAEGEDFTAHGATIKEALEDLRYKVAEDQDKPSVAADVMSSGRVTLAQFRALTGACREGIRHHLEIRGIDLGTIDDMALPEALGLMEGTSFGEEFKRQIA